MKQYLTPVLIAAVGAIVGMIVYDMFVKNLVGNFETNNYELDEQGNIMQVAA